ncbi:glycosyltransferase [uncultured Bacteroides sp.]|uniref:glycosyltransferase n=1 Tax=uncultured Bacteroides sp. TaxID=162156 RepID=UPI002603EA47|nr:glycosyltransferase [uncultured Bacteroides sp.]
MRVLLINITNGRGSTGKIVSSIARILQETGNEAYIGYGYFDSKERNTYCIKGYGINTLRWAILKSRITGYMGFDSKRATEAFLNWVNEIKPDVIHLHNIHTGYVNIELLFSYIKRKKIPVVWTLHDCWPFTGRCSHFVNANCYKWKTGCYACQDKNTFPKTYYFDHSKKMYELKKEIFTGVDNMLLVTPSNWLKMFVEQSFLKEYKCLTIHNGVNTNVFKPNNENKIRIRYSLDKYEGIVISVASSWSNRKGLHLIYKLADDMKSYKFIIVGLNYKQLESCPKNIIGIGRLSNQNELAEFYSAADVFINCTLADNFPTVNLEALACNIPVVTFNTGGSPEGVPSGAGFVVPQNDLSSMEKKIKELVAHKTERNYREYAIKYFDERTLFLEYIKLYKKVLECKIN